MTASHGKRVRSAYLSVESIGSGSLLPRKFFIVVPEKYHQLRSLQRLVNRGAELIVDDPLLGPHNKYFHYLSMDTVNSLPLVTVDDDALYPKNWLRDLVIGRNPNLLRGYAAKSISIRNGKPTNYRQWPQYVGGPSFLCFIESVWGVYYPLQLLESLKKRGTDFLDTTPRNDDIWVNVNAAELGIKAEVVTGSSSMGIPRYIAQRSGLAVENVIAGHNNEQFLAAVGSRALERYESSSIS